MTEHENLKWFLIRQFILVLAIVGLAEYLLMLVLNVCVMPFLMNIFFPNYSQITVSGLENVFYLLTLFLLLVLSAICSLISLLSGGVAKISLEWVQEQLSRRIVLINESTSIYTLNRIESIALFACVIVLISVMALPFALGATYYAKIVIKEFDTIQRLRDEQTREFDRKRNLMLSDIAHDLRTPMTTVNGYAKALAEGMVKDDEKVKEYLCAIQNKSVRMNELINLLFEYVKLDSDGFELTKEKLDICELVRENAALVYSDIEDAGMHIEADIPDESYFVMADRLQMSRVIANLLSNALHHNNAGTTIRVRVSAERENLNIIIEDNGIIIPSDAAQHIFDPFAKADSSRSNGGSGLGLSIARKVTELHGWELQLLQPASDGFTKAFVITVC